MCFSMGNAVRWLKLRVSMVDIDQSDAEAKKDLREAVGAVGSAVSATIDDAGNAIRRRGGSDETWPEPERPDGGSPTDTEPPG